MTYQGANPSVWVGGLDPQLNEQKLYDYFVRVGPVASVRVCVDSATQKSLGYGYVNFQNAEDAEKALEHAGNKLGKRYLRIAKIQRDPAKRRSGVTNIVVKKLPDTIDTVSLKEMFSKYGRLTSVGLACDEEGKSRGYARIAFESEDSAAEAVREMNGMELDDQAIIVERFQPQYRDEQLKQFTNLYVKNLDTSVTDDKLKEFFSKYGETTSAKVRDFGDVKTEVGFGYVAFANHEGAAKAVEELNGKECEIAKEGEKLDVSRFRSREERQRDRERARRERVQQYSKYPNLYVKGFDDSVTSDRLKELFERHGETVSVRVMMDRDTGVSRCFGFVSMKEQNAAAQAIQELNGSTFLCPRPLFVTYALRKDARRHNLEERNKQQYRMRQAPMMGGMGMSPMGFMGPGPQQMFGGGGYPQPQMPFMNPRVPMMAPMGGGMGGPMRQLVTNPMNQMRSGPRPMTQKPPMQPMMPPQQHMAPPQSHSLANTLSNLTPEQQKNVLGERLYHHIVRTNPANAAKITGMLLEMDKNEIISMLESPMLLDSKVAEAQDVLNRHLGA